MKHANVDTFIVLRSLVPLATSLTEVAVLGSPFPPTKALLALCMIVFGAIGFTFSEGVVTTAYFWGMAYVVSMVIDTVLVKKVVTEVKLTPWGLVLYNNLVASAMFPLFALMNGELFVLAEAFTAMNEASNLLSVIISCLFGVSISFFGLNARKLLSATAFSVLGVLCKFVTVVINTLLWEHHASSLGIFFLCICIGSGIVYQQVLQRAVVTAKLEETKVDDGESKVTNNQKK